jgi:hypothetical protein
MRPKSYDGLSEGAAALAAICTKGTITAVAAKLSVTEGSVRHFIAGRRLPTPKVRKKISATYGIDQRSWRWAATPPEPRAKTSRGGATPAAAPPVSTAPPARPRSTAGLSSRDQLDDVIRRLEEDLAACGDDVPKNHKASLYGQLTNALAKRSKLDGEGDLTVAAIVKSRAWTETIAPALLSAFREYPKAAEALAKILGGAT